MLRFLSSKILSTFPRLLLGSALCRTVRFYVTGEVFVFASQKFFFLFSRFSVRRAGDEIEVI